MRKIQTMQKTPFVAPEVLPKVVPAPTDGWDAISPLAAMDPKRAPILDNFVPRPGWVELRGGYTAYVGTLTGSPVETLMVYRSGSAEEMFAASGSIIRDVSTSVSETDVVTGLNSARWQYVNFKPAGATNVIQLVNGADNMRQYNGTVWSTPSITDGSGTPIDTSTFINISTIKRRLWYVVNNSTLAYFMPTDAIQGQIAGSQDFGSLFSKGGYLVAASSWTVDGGSGPQDYGLFISSRGQVALYSGIDPTNASAWNLVGVFDIAPPIGRRCLLRVGSDVGIITQQGVIPISQALPFDPSADRSVAITARIQSAMASAAMLAGNSFGWQLISFPAQQLAIVNVPIQSNDQVQYVMNTLTGAWCRFTGWGANCFEVYNNNLYFGDNDGNVQLAYSGSMDLNTPISANMQCAFNWFDEPGRIKRMSMIQPLLVLGGSLNPTISVDTDFTTSTQTATVSTFSSSVVWGTAVWGVDLWPSGTVQYNSFLSVEALGHALAVRLQAAIDTTPTGLGVFDFGTFDNATFDQGYSTALPVLQVNAFNTIIELGAVV